MFNAHPADTAPLPAGEAVLEEGQMRKKIRNFSQSDKHIDFTCTRLRKKKKKDIDVWCLLFDYKPKCHF